jgi:hypothetical protein
MDVDCAQPSSAVVIIPVCVILPCHVFYNIYIVINYMDGLDGTFLFDI